MSQRKTSSTLLLVDDDPNIIRLLENVIERSLGDSLVIESLTDPSAARERINEGGIDILVTDLEMPGVNGIDLLQCAKRQSASTQVLFFTGHSSRESLFDALELGAADYLLKPLDQAQLLELVTQAYGRQRRWQQALAETWRQGREKKKACSATNGSFSRK